MKTLVSTQQMMAEAKFYKDYSRWSYEKGGYETWDESVSRVIAMHAQKYQKIMSPELTQALATAQAAYSDKLVLGAQRALQFGGEQLFKHEARMYNCSSSHADRARFFQEAMYLLLCGCGVGFSVQKRHVSKMPSIAPREPGKVKTFVVPDSIEGWADAFGVLASSYFESDSPFPEYKGYAVHFDFSQIRPKGSMISGGFKAPGPDGLRKALVNCEALIESELAQGTRRMRPIVVYDFTMHMSDAVLSGGVRRSATLCMFDKDDDDMLNAKTGYWYLQNPQRGRSNNSVMLKRDELTRDEWANIMKAVRSFGEPGFIFTDDLDSAYNPCVEIGMLPIAENGEPGFQFCNLVEINGGKCASKEVFFKACEAGAILGTLQAGYTNFKYLSDATRRITEREALIGVSVTGWMNNPEVLFDEAILKEGARIVKETNAKIAKLIGINQAARTTCVKPAGNTSVLLGTGSGIHGEHSPWYFRHVQMNKDDEVAKLIQEVNPKMVERIEGSSTSVVVSFPVVARPGSRFKAELMGVKQLEYVKKAQQCWVNEGTNLELCTRPTLRHNVSNTISVDDWDEVEEYIYQNRQWFAGISLLAATGDKAYYQAPFTQVLSAEEILREYGDASMFASGLIVDGLHAFDNNLWRACAVALGGGDPLTSEAKDLLKRDWARRFHKFADNFCEGNTERAAACLKDSYNLHKWTVLQRTIQQLDFSTVLSEPIYVDADTLASQGCAGGACEVAF